MSSTDALQDTELLAAVLDGAPDGIVICSEDGKIRYTNSQIGTLFGYDRSELLGQPVEVLLPEASREAHVVRRNAYNASPHVRGMGVGMKLRARRRDGEEFPVQVSLSPVHVHGGIFAVAAVRDITERDAADALAHELDMLEDRERIGHDLHDRIIQRLFATGLSLQGTAARAPGPIADRINAAVDEIDLAIRDLRGTIFALSTRRTQSSLRSELIDLVAEAKRMLGHTPVLTLDGPLDSAVGEHIRDDLLAVLRESLSNIARHAHALRTDISLVATSDTLTLVVEDNGVGVPTTPTSEGNGLRNMATRAQRHGGDVIVEPGAAGGTRLSWHVRLSA